MKRHDPGTPTGGFLDIGIVLTPMRGEDVSGDNYYIGYSGDRCLLAAIDGLGHGSEALAAARIAGEVLDRNPDDTLIRQMRTCHEALQAMRGVVMNLARFNETDETVSWTGVGNVGGVLIRNDGDGEHRFEHIIPRSGVVGFRLPQLVVSTLPVRSGDTLILTTDGVRDGFFESVDITKPAQEIAETVSVRFGRDNDDTLVVVAQYRGRNR